jgi:periplasmic divalent cation tolerance protein
MYIIVTTCEPKDAKNILQQLLKQRLIACGNIFPAVRSLYWWEGKIQDDEESFLFMETTDNNLAAALQVLNEVHPYDVPKILHWQPNGNDSYTNWLQQVTK